MTDTTKAPDGDRFASIHLRSLGIANMTELHNRVFEANVDLGKLDVASLTPKQLNTLLVMQTGFANASMRLFFDHEQHLILTTDYRYQEEHQDTRYRVSWMTMNIDFVFGKRPDRLD